MGKISILNKEVSDIIAAGEVVENPASLVKELVENSLDAGATSIKIEISNGGREVRISDNGEGMSSSDLEICTLRHATSKISKKEDLFKLSTYGFRGEALSSIASVAKMSISTKRDGEDGSILYSEAGNVVGMELFSKDVGTDINIGNLFFNVPARLKFLRSSENEYFKIKNIILKEALVNYKVAFTLNIEGKTKISTSGNGIENTILELFNGQVLKSMSKFDWGYLGNATLNRSSKDYIFTYFNGRYAKSHMVDKAIIDAYYTRLDKGKYPFAIVFMDIDPSYIDVNVHPSKKIVKFTNEPAIYKSVRKKIEEALDRADRTVLSESIGNSPVNYSAKSFSGMGVNVDMKNSIDANNYNNSDINNTNKINNISSYKSYDSYRDKDNKSNPNNSTINKIDSSLFSDIKSEIKDNIKMENQKIEDSNADDYFKDNIFVGQIYDSFSIVQCKDRIEIYDQHIVQERILYEEIKGKYESKKIISQSLLVPIRISLSALDKGKVLDNITFFKDFGFNIEDFGSKDIVIRSVPLFNFLDSIENIFKDLVDILIQGKIKDEIKDIREKTIIMMSCRKSIKAGDRVSTEEMKFLINKLHKIGKYSCPHGRNIIIDLPLSYIEKKFKRR